MVPTFSELDKIPGFLKAFAAYSQVFFIIFKATS